MLSCAGVFAGSSRLYEDPDVDEYSSMEDLGYARRSIPNQQEFIMSQLDFLRVSMAASIHSTAPGCVKVAPSSLTLHHMGRSCTPADPHHVMFLKVHLRLTCETSPTSTCICNIILPAPLCFVEGGPVSTLSITIESHVTPASCCSGLCCALVFVAADQ